MLLTVGSLSKKQGGPVVMSLRRAYIYISIFAVLALWLGERVALLIPKFVYLSEVVGSSTKPTPVQN